MGDWRTVQIIGTCEQSEVDKLREEISYSVYDHTNKFYCLSYNAGLCGLPLWPAVNINAVGNLSERDYDATDVKRDLVLLSKIAPSLSVKVHVGNAYESTACVATVVLKDGQATIELPEIDTIPPIPEDQMALHFQIQIEQQMKQRGV